MRESTKATTTRRRYEPVYKQLMPRQWLRITAAMLVVGTTVGSFLPGGLKVVLGTHPNEHFDPWHRVYHFSTFGLMTTAILLLARSPRDELRALLFVTGLGCFIEVTQYCAGMADVFEWWDVRDDLLAVVTAFLIVQTANWWDRIFCQHLRDDTVRVKK